MLRGGFLELRNTMIANVSFLHRLTRGPGGAPLIKLQNKEIPLLDIRHFHPHKVGLHGVLSETHDLISIHLEVRIEWEIVSDVPVDNTVPSRVSRRSTKTQTPPYRCRLKIQISSWTCSSSIARSSDQDSVCDNKFPRAWPCPRFQRDTGQRPKAKNPLNHLHTSHPYITFPIVLWRGFAVSASSTAPTSPTSPSPALSLKIEPPPPPPPPSATRARTGRHRTTHSALSSAAGRCSKGRSHPIRTSRKSNYS